jgi:ABC-type branched-subunit amino acid transport system permease subunit
MNYDSKTIAKYGGILVFGIVAPFIFPNYTFQLAMLWVMITFALTWDILGGQMGYNSLGNIFFSAPACISARWSRSGCITTSVNIPRISAPLKSIIP